MTVNQEINNQDNNAPNATMDAASALTALGDEESKGSRPNSPVSNNRKPNPAVDTEKPVQSESADAPTAKDEPGEAKNEEEPARRYLPDHKKPDAAPTFPEKLMNLMRYAEKQDQKEFCIAWCEDGKSFVIRNPDAFTRQVVPKFFKATKFSSFTRKLYRWGFRQINRGIGPDDPIIFGNEFFQKENRALIAKMRSVTAAGTRKAEEHRHMAVMAGVKRGFDDSGMATSLPYGDDDNHKRMLFNQLLHQQKHMNMMSGSHNSPPYYSGMNGSVPLTSALRPNLGLSNGSGPGMMGGPNSMMMGGQQQQPQQAHSGGMMSNSGNNHNMPNNNMQMMNQMNPGNMMMGMNHQFNNNGGNNNGMPNHPQQMNQMQPFGNMSSGPQYPDARSTADIVNAAIAALRHAS